MRSLFKGARLRGMLALCAGALALHLPLQAFAADRGAGKPGAGKSIAGKSSAGKSSAGKSSVGKSDVGKVAEPRAVARATAAASPKRAVATPKRADATVARPGASAAASSRASRASRAGLMQVAGTPSRGARTVKTSFAPRSVEPTRLSIGQAIGLHMVDDPLDLRSSVAMVIDQQSGETLYQKNADAVLPIASITKIMTAMVVLDSGASMSDMLEVTEADRDLERHSRSRLPIGSRLSRGELMQLSLMSSENRAANVLGRHHRGGLAAFVEAMNSKAQAIGMSDSRFAEPTGLSSSNVSNARDLSRMVRAAHAYPMIRQYSTATDLAIDAGYRQVSFRSTNRLIDDPDWDIGLQKTGYISEAGKCLVMQARIDGRQIIIVLLDATATQFRFADAQRLRRWIAERPRIDTTVTRLDTRS
jgi:D-alanyl-D-alanine endopeptidase (penicillin-binding protein 7)